MRENEKGGCFVGGGESGDEGVFSPAHHLRRKSFLPNLRIKWKTIRYF